MGARGGVPGLAARGVSRRLGTQRHLDRRLALDHPAVVPWWPEERRQTTFGHLLVRVVAETAQHAGHADIVRESIDGQAGPDRDLVGDAYWGELHAAIQAAADAHR